jgi:perosamine synthetase
MGPVCQEFEERIAEMHGYKYAVTTNSATVALHLALLANNIGVGDEVVVPALTFVSTALAVTYTGAKPIFADVDQDNLCLDWRDVDRRLTDRTKAVIPVDFGGYPFQRADFYKNRYLVIQDAAHNVGGKTYGDEVCFSFHPVKNLATGDGGCVLTNCKKNYERMKQLRWCGIDRSTFERLGKGYNWEYDIHEVGYKYHWNDIQAAIGLVQLDRLEEMNDKRRALAICYYNELMDVPGITLPAFRIDHKWHLFIIRVDA